MEINKGDLLFLDESKTFIVKKGRIKIIDHGENFLNPIISTILGISF